MTIKHLLFISPFVFLLCGSIRAQQDYTISMNGDSDDNFGDDMYERSMDVQPKEAVDSNSSELAKYNKKRFQSLLWERKKSLLQQANRQLDVELDRRKFQERINQRTHHYDKTLAEAWVRSPTGKRDGRKWYELMEDEKDMYRNRYLDFHQKNKTPAKVESFEPEGFFIPEKDYAHAWQANAERTGQNKNWRELTESERSKFRRGYRQHQLGMYYLAKSMDTIPFYQVTEYEVDLALLR